MRFMFVAVNGSKGHLGDCFNAEFLFELVNEIMKPDLQSWRNCRSEFQKPADVALFVTQTLGSNLCQNFEMEQP